jgi:hypothetical protein
MRFSVGTGLPAMGRAAALLTNPTMDRPMFRTTYLLACLLALGLGASGTASASR